MSFWLQFIRKDYPTTGVLKLQSKPHRHSRTFYIRKDYPTTGVLKRDIYLIVDSKVMQKIINQEGLPDYWGIETILCDAIMGK